MKLQQIYQLAHRHALVMGKESFFFFCLTRNTFEFDGFVYSFIIKVPKMNLVFRVNSMNVPKPKRIQIQNVLINLPSIAVVQRIKFAIKLKSMRCRVAGVTGSSLSKEI